MWPVAEAKARLSEVLKRARNGEPQIIGLRDRCVVMSLEDYQALKERHMGRELVALSHKHALEFEIPLPSRKDPSTHSAFDWAEGE